MASDTGKNTGILTYSNVHPPPKHLIAAALIYALIEVAGFLSSQHGVYTLDIVGVVFMVTYTTDIIAPLVQNTITFEVDKTCQSTAGCSSGRLSLGHELGAVRSNLLVVSHATEAGLQQENGYNTSQERRPLRAVHDKF
jgi:hypothetical protein